MAAAAVDVADAFLRAGADVFLRAAGADVLVRAADAGVVLRAVGTGVSFVGDRR